MARRADYDPRSATELITDLLPTETSCNADDELGRLVDNVVLSSPQDRSASRRPGVSRSDGGFPSADIWDLPLETKSALLYSFAALCWREGYARGTKYWLDQFWESIRVWLTGTHRPKAGEQLPFALPDWWHPPVEPCEPVILPDLWENEFQTPTRYPNGYIADHDRNQVHESARIPSISHDVQMGGNCTVMPGARLVVRTQRLNSKGKALLNLGKYVMVGSEAVVEPTKLKYKGKYMYLPGNIGDYTIIGMGAKVKAYSIGNFVSIGTDCIIGDRVVIQDGAYIGNGVIVPAGTVVPRDCSWTGQKHCFATKFQQQYFPVRDRIRSMYAEMFCHERGGEGRAY
ncbi:hypothetical protein CALVIDRAFT_534559 [Calocera viscosa TUFC12733]|uniref:Dynactin subunit 5 n=1 Tax=Calocera viscosa (strain TUFC12733) TaxID=1330018 RepID=A0A167PQI2_CALVF|nr:hypothetical protein CALVIDRAFT_534559 [Calocera viscosa TUFC12733]